ncbi:hypothetical protein C8F01DRAFT_1183078 [Mycena amicta]|nr:hypothetical protein C8F01DRAFT_1183078 [Mycena amicta]
MDKFTVAATLATRPLKRSRSEFPTPETALRHSEFYFDTDTLCVIRVEDTLFKVHTFLLTQASTVFSNLFELPQGTLTTEGTSDANPIVLAGDSASDFEGLLMYLYASPSIAPQNIHISELQPILGVFRLAHKYEMTSWNLWASNALQAILISSNDTFSSDDFQACFESACQQADGWLVSKTTTYWRDRIIAGDLPAAPALDAAERRDPTHRPFLAALYADALQKLPTSVPNVTPLSYPGFQPIHIQRIFVGNWSLNAWWTNFIRYPIPLPAAAGCSTVRHTDVCTSELRMRWKHAVAVASSIYKSVAQVRDRVARVQLLLANGETQSASFGQVCRHIMSKDANDPFVVVLTSLNDLTAHFFAADPT